MRCPTSGRHKTLFISDLIGTCFETLLRIIGRVILKRTFRLKSCLQFIGLLFSLRCSVYRTVKQSLFVSKITDSEDSKTWTGWSCLLYIINITSLQLCNAKQNISTTKLSMD